MTSLWAQLPLAAGSGGANQPNSSGQEFGSSEPVALILIICLFIAVAFLIRSMTKHLKKVPASFDPPTESTEEAVDSAQDTAEASADVSADAGVPVEEPEREKQDH
jgi:hypothetical protein